MLCRFRFKLGQRCYSGSSNAATRPQFLCNALPLMRSLRLQLQSRIDAVSKDPNLPLLHILLGDHQSRAGNSLASIRDEGRVEVMQCWAGLAWTLDHFLSQFSFSTSASKGYATDNYAPGRSIPALLEQTISKQFGSVAAFKGLFSAHSMAVLGSGTTWLLYDIPAGSMHVCNAYNTDTPFCDGAALALPNGAGRSEQPTRGEATSQDSASSILSMLTRTNHTAKPAASSLVSPAANSSAHNASALNADMRSGADAAAPKTAAVVAPNSRQLTPLLSLHMWEHAWLPDYGLDRASYIRDFWTHVNWERADAILAAMSAP